MLEFSISGPKVYAEQGILNHVSVIVRQGTIVDMRETAYTTLQFPDNYHLIPGLIDLHVHGANHCDVMDATSAALSTISQTLAAEGTTAFLATTMTSAHEKIEKALKVVREFMQNSSAGAKVLGVHLEGPFISSKKAGAQCRDHIASPSIELFKQWQRIAGDQIKLVTLAPELSNGTELIHYLKQQNIVAAIGHSDASYEETVAAIKNGCNYITHIFNAMRGMHQREPGVVTAALLENVLTELIVDGVHLHPAIVQLILKLKGKEKIILVTDAMRAKCLTDGCYELGGQAVEVKQGVAKLPDGTLAGSVLKLPTAIRNMMHFTHCNLFDAVKMASENPAKALGIFDKKGSIALQKDADLVILDDQWNVVMTICEGRIVYQDELRVFTNEH